MGRRRKISDLPIPGYDRACRGAGNFIVNFGLSLFGLAYYAYKSTQPRYVYTPSYIYGTDNISYHKVEKAHKFQPKTHFIKEISLLESLVSNNKATVAQCERLAFIYSATGDFFKERYARLCAIRRFFCDNGLEESFESFLDSFNDKCKHPPISISKDETINTEYRLLLSKAELAAKRSLDKFKYHNK